MYCTAFMAHGHVKLDIEVFCFQGRAKSIHDNMLRGLDPTPKFDSHFSKNANRVTSLTSYKAFEYTQVFVCLFFVFTLILVFLYICIVRNISVTQCA